VKHKKLLFRLATVLCGAVLLTQAEAGGSPKGEKQKGRLMKIRIKLESQTFTATLDESATSRDFVALLPMTLTLKDYNRTEKISDLPKKLSTEGSPAGIDPDVGDIAYYAPWGNIAIFYRDFGYSDGLVKLGKLEGEVDALNNRETTKATIELIKD
jgi:hypothetical protein